MASNVIPFRPRAQQQRPRSVRAHMTPQERIKDLPEWLKERQIDWIFEEAARRERDAKK